MQQGLLQPISHKKILIYRAEASEGGIIYVYIGKTGRTLEKRRLEHEKNALQNSPFPLHKKINEIARVHWTWTKLLECDEAEADDQEQRFINVYREEAYRNQNLIVLNDSHNGVNNTEQNKPPKNDFGIPRANKQKNYKPSEIGNKFLRISGKIKPVINLATKQKYTSVLHAERDDHVSRATIKISCNTGKMLANGTRYAYLDIDDNPMLKEGHSKDHYIGKNARKVKELISGLIYTSATEVAHKYGISVSAVGDFANGTYMIAKGKYVFCYLDANNNEVLTSNHTKALDLINKKQLIKYVAWPVSFTYEKAKEKKEIGYFKTLSDLYEKLKIKNKSHVKAVCDGKRSHVEMYRVAYYNSEVGSPELTVKHLEKSKKNLHKVYCVNDNKKFDNCTEAGTFYGIGPNQIGLCARGMLKSVWVKNNGTGTKKRFQFRYLDKNEMPIIPAKHLEPLSQREGVSRIVLINPHPDLIKHLGTDKFSSLAEFCRCTGVGYKRAQQYRKNKNVDLLGYEFIEVD
ncbi:MAG: hypothetical protein WCW33_03135 [Candidatus Babeliales bacterium]|jgi:hypothetical protein